ncbi:MAG: hypothetical protein PVJ03_00125 [Chromatiaceae bacterium]
MGEDVGVCGIQYPVHTIRALGFAGTDPDNLQHTLERRHDAPRKTLDHHGPIAAGRANGPRRSRAAGELTHGYWAISTAVPSC